MKSSMQINFLLDAVYILLDLLNSKENAQISFKESDKKKQILSLILSLECQMSKILRLKDICARKYTSNSIKIYVMLFNPLRIVESLYKSLPNPLEFAGGEI